MTAADEAAVPVARPMPMIQVTAIRPSVLPAPLPKVQTDWPGKADGRAQAYGLVYGGGLFLLLLLFSVVAGFVGIFF